MLPVDQTKWIDDRASVEFSYLGTCVSKCNYNCIEKWNQFNCLLSMQQHWMHSWTKPNNNIRNLDCWPNKFLSLSIPEKLNAIWSTSSTVYFSKFLKSSLLIFIVKMTYIVLGAFFREKKMFLRFKNDFVSSWL